MVGEEDQGSAFRQEEAEMSMELSVIGAGNWGTTIANMLAEKGYNVKLWVRRREILRDIVELRENRQYLPKVRLSENINATGSIREAVEGTSFIVSVVPSAFVRSVFSEAADHIGDGTIVVSASKGIEESTLMTVSQIFKEMLAGRKHPSLAVLSGPSFAKEVSQKLPAAVCAASDRLEVAERVQQVFSLPYFRVYTNTDIVGVELCGALKNVIAIASGISDGLGLGTNARAALITRGLAEMARLGKTLGANNETFYGLAGLGDMVLTCTGDLSRNRSVGLAIGGGRKLKDILGEMKMVAEGVKTSRAAYELARKHGVEMPITEKVQQVLYEGKLPKDAVGELMTRGLKGE